MAQTGQFNQAIPTLNHVWQWVVEGGICSHMIFGAWFYWLGRQQFPAQGVLNRHPHWSLPSAKAKYELLVMAVGALNSRALCQSGQGGFKKKDGLMWVLKEEWALDRHGAFSEQIHRMHELCLDTDTAYWVKWKNSGNIVSERVMKGHLPSKHLKGGVIASESLRVRSQEFAP